MNTPVVDRFAPLKLKRPDLLRKHAFIDGVWVDGPRAIQVLNPATLQPLGAVPDLATEDTVRAVAAAHAAFGPWSRRSAKDRASILHRWFESIVTHADDLAMILTAEQGKPLAEAKAEIIYAASFIEYFAEEAKRVYGDTIPGPSPDKRLVVIKQPVGVVAAVTPWNFPAAMITRKVGPALAVGCTVVLKPSELTPFSALALTLLGTEAGLPSGVLNIVTGQASPIGEVLTSDPRVAKFTFTGSTAVGKMLAGRCMATVKRVSLELGGNAPFIVFNDADLDAAVDGAMVSKFRNTGQTCVCANRLLVQSDVYDAFAAKLALRVGSLVVGHGLASPTDQGPLIDHTARDKVQRHVSDALFKGAEVKTGGKPIDAAGAFFEPTVLVGVTRDMLLMREETFGPVAGLLRFETEDEAIEIANSTTAGLAAYIYTRDASRIWRMGEALQYGMVGLNTGLISSELAPFGGMKESGLGREGSRYGADQYLDIKLLCFGVAAS